MTEVEELLNERETDSELSVQVSFTLEDILNERLEHEEEEDDVEGLLSDEQQSEENPATKSQESRDVAKSSSSKAIAVREELAVRRHTRIADTMLSHELISQNLQYSALSNVSRIFDTANTSIVGIGVPCCLSATSKRFLAIGTSLSNIVLFEVGVRQHKLLHPDQTANYGPALSLDISRDSKYMVAGFANGAITVWDLSYFTLAKTIPSASGQPITKVSFCSDAYSEFVSIDLDGNVFLHTVEKYVWVSVRNKRLVNRAAGVLYHDFRAAAFGNSRWFLGLISTEFVLVVALGSSVQIVAKLIRPLQLANAKIPNFQFSKLKRNGEWQDTALISWGCNIYTYLFDSTSRSSQFTEICVYRHEEAIFGMRSLGQSMLLVHDSSNRLHQINMNVKENANSYELTSELVTQKFYKDKLGKPLKNCSNTLCQCMSQQSREVYLICRDRILRGRLFRWSEFVSMLISTRRWRESLKLLMELFDGKWDIFADRVTITPQTVLLFQDLLLGYAKTRISQLAEQNSANSQPSVSKATELRETLEGCIEFCVHCNLEQFLFRQLHDSLCQERGVAQQFMVALEPFIQNNLIRRIPNHRLYEAVVEYYSAARAELVERLVVRLDKDSIDYVLTVELCLRLHLYRAMVYVSQLNDDFLTPAKRLLESIDRTDSLPQCLEMLYDMISLVGQGKFITGQDLPEKSAAVALEVLLQWLLLQETFRALAQVDAARYFRVLAALLTSDTAKKVGGAELGELGVFKRLEELRQELLKQHRDSLLPELASCLIHCNLQWTLDITTRMFCLQHLHPKQDIDELSQFISRNYEFLKELPEWQAVSTALPQETQALIAIEDGNMPLALERLSHLQLGQQSRRRLFERMGRYHFSGNVEAMAGIDCRRAAQYLMEQYSYEEISREVEKVRQPFLRYSLTRRVMRLDKDSRVQWGRQLLLAYLESMCFYRQEKRVLHELKKHIFPIEDALAIVTKHKLPLCQAYLSQPAQAVKIYQRVYQLYFLSNFHKLQVFEYCCCRDLKYVFYAMLQLLKSGVIETTAEDWFQLLETVLQPLRQPMPGTRPSNRVLTADIVQKLYKKKNSESNPFFSSLFEILERTLLEVSTHTTIDSLASQIQAYLPVLSTGFVLNSFRATLQTYNRQSQLYRISGKLLLRDMVSNLSEIMQENTEGVPSQPNCATCHNEVFGTDNLLFRCGHTFHRKCLEKLKCPLCTLEKGEIDPSPERPAVHRQPDHPIPRFSNVGEEQDQKLLYSLMGFDKMVADEQSELQSFATLYDSFMLLY